MADPRRRGRGRSGRGGRIPRKGEGGAAASLQDEAFISFPLDVSGPLVVNSPIEGDAVAAMMHLTLLRERQVAAALARAAEHALDPAVRDVLVQVERHRDQLSQLARDLGAGTGPEENVSADGDTWDLVALQRLAWLGWRTLQRAAQASGDRRIDRVARPVLREKERHAEVLEALALREATSRLFRELE